MCLKPSGDRLLEVDGVSFQSFSYRQAVERLRNTGEVTEIHGQLDAPMAVIVTDEMDRHVKV